jgi:hypothetical protein
LGFFENEVTMEMEQLYAAAYADVIERLLMNEPEENGNAAD